MHPRPRPPLIRLGVPHLAVVWAGVATVSVAMWLLTGPQLEDLHARDVTIPRMQTTHGFGWGPVSFECPGLAPQTYHGIVRVLPGGRFARLGFRPGDVPWGYHGHGYANMLAGLEAADRGRSATIELWNADECRRRLGARRSIAVE